MEFGTFLHLLDCSSSVKAKDGCSLRFQPYSPLSLLWVWIQFLVEKLRSHKLHSVAKIKNNRIKTKFEGLTKCEAFCQHYDKM